MFSDLYNKRRQIRTYDPDREPGKDVIQNTLELANKLVASKQNLMPYKIYVVGPFNEEINQGLYDLSQSVMPVLSKNFNLITAPYQFIYTLRFPTGNSETNRLVKEGHDYSSLDQNGYTSKYNMSKTSVEVGMHAVVLSSLLIEQGLEISYTQCLPNWQSAKGLFCVHGLDFIDHDIILVMSTGYIKPTMVIPESKFVKPPNEEIIKWI